jgi:hypothetical protein
MHFYTIFALKRDKLPRFPAFTPKTNLSPLAGGIAIYLARAPGVKPLEARPHKPGTG